MDQGIKRGTIAQMACRHLPIDDCETHPNCQWTKEYMDKRGRTTRAHCSSKGRPSRITRKSPKRVAGAKQGATKNTWIQAIAQARADNPEWRGLPRKGTDFYDFVKAIQAEIKGQAGAGFYDQLGAGCRKGVKGRCVKWSGDDQDGCIVNPNSGRCTQEGRVRRMYDIRKPLSPKQTAALEKARAARAANVRARKQVGAGFYHEGDQVGAGCRKGVKGRCVKWSGDDQDGCIVNPSSGRCTQEGRVRRMYDIRKPLSPKQTAALEKARAARAANVRARKQAGGSAFGWF